MPVAYHGRTTLIAKYARRMPREEELLRYSLQKHVRPPPLKAPSMSMQETTHADGHD